MIVTLATYKGGSGKSTLAINLAFGLAGRNRKNKVLLIDADPQATCSTLYRVQKDMPIVRDNFVIYNSPEDPHKTIRSCVVNFRHIIIDTAGRGDKMYQAAAQSDMVLIPIKPSPADIAAAVETVKAMRIIKEEKPKLKLFFVGNLISPRTVLSVSVKDALADLFPDIPVLQTMICRREIYIHAMNDAQSVMEYDPKSAAAKEMEKLVLEVMKLSK